MIRWTTGPSRSISRRIFNVSNDNRFRKPALSANAAFIAFSGLSAVYVLNRTTGALEPISVAVTGEVGPIDADDAAITPDGRYVAFTALASQLGPQVTADNAGGMPQIYVRDRSNAKTVMASRSALGEPATYRSSSWPDAWWRARLSADGRFVSFMTDATNLVFKDPFDLDPVIKDMRTGSVRRLSQRPDGESTGYYRQGGDLLPISADGRLVAVNTVEPLSPEDTVLSRDIYVIAHEPEPLTPFTARINFQPAGSPAVSGYLTDSGAAFADRGNGNRYGWNTRNDFARDRNSATSPDQRYDTLLLMQPPGNSFVWEMAVPSGSYRLHVVLGDPSYFDGTVILLAEGSEVARGRTTASAPWIDQRAVVTVTDGRLRLSCAAGASNTKICFLELEQLAASTLRINMQPASAPAVSGWLVDGGLPFGRRGTDLSYGWNIRLDDLARDRNNALSPDQRYDTLIHTQAANRLGIWEAAVPNGWYEAHVVGGDPSFTDNRSWFQIEGLSVTMRTFSERWSDGTANIEVIDGRVTVAPAPGAQNAKICFIELMPIPLAPTGVN
jgi:hypothetical protein